VTLEKQLLVELVYAFLQAGIFLSFHDSRRHYIVRLRATRTHGTD
jgi:hypothetical protein